MSLLRCLKCTGILDCGPDRCRCVNCGATWPVSNGIPRFFQMPDHYWGEVGRNQALELIEAARQGPWQEAVRARFPEKDNMIYGLLDPQRASWASMLGLNEKSTALDIGSGYGCISQSISRFAGDVYSVEAVTERIDFTKERLRQEQIHNVHLVQASATALPLAENSFDLVVVNGVLEWVGEWDLTVDPRTVQINFLKKIFRLLKDDGVLLIGIENRIGWGLFLGGHDHSGMPFTTLVPRGVASFMLRHNSQPHFRTRLNARKQYRTYTYSERGYRNLLTDAGFGGVSSYWADPGYNQPYRLVPLAVTKWVREHFVELLDHPSAAPRRSWRRRLKRIALPIFPWIVSDFMLLATKPPVRKTALDTWVEERLAESNGNGRDPRASAVPFTWALHTGAFKEKSIVHLGDPSTGSDLGYLKIFTGEDRKDFFKAEATNRDKVHDGLSVSGTSLVRVPQSYGTLHIGNTAYYMEEASHGTLVSSMVRNLGYFKNTKTVERDFSQISDRLIELALSLQNMSEVRSINPDCREIPGELHGRPDLIRAIGENRYFQGRSSTTWIQHGDLSTENTHFDRQTGQLVVFDWGDLAGGFPPLYDFFQFFYSTGYLMPADETVHFASEEDRWIATFKAVFLSDSGFGRTARRQVLHASERLNISPQQVPALLLEFLIVRSNYCQQTPAVQRRVQCRLLELCIAEFTSLRMSWQQSKEPPAVYASQNASNS